MANKLRYVFDTNTLISAALLEHSTPARAFRFALERGRVLLSSATLGELAEVLRRQKFDRYVTPNERDEFLEALVDRAFLIEPLEEIQACRDPKDDKFLELAISGRADSIVTGDDDLLVLNPFRGIRIQVPNTFLEDMMKSQSGDEV